MSATDNGQWKVVFAVDNSGSTGGAGQYWASVSELVGEYDIYDIYCLWNRSATTVSRKELQKNIDTKYGTGGTSPHSIVECLRAGKYELIMTTDGQISESDISKISKSCDDRKVSFGTVTLHCIGDVKSMNLTIIAGFIGHADICKLYINGELYTDTSVNVIDELLNNQDKIDIESLTKVNNSLRIKIIGARGDSIKIQTIKNKILLLRTDVVSHYSHKSSKIDVSKCTTESEAVTVLKTLLPKSDTEISNALAIVDELVTLCDNALKGNINYAFGSTARIERASGSTSTEETPPPYTEPDTDVPPSYSSISSKGLYVSNTNVTYAIDTKLLDLIINNPFIVFDSPELVGLIRESLKFGNAGGQPQIFIPTVGDYVSSDTYANKHALAMLIFGRETLVGMSALWTAVVYIILRDSPIDGITNEFMEQFRQYTRYCIMNSKSYMSMSGTGELYPAVLATLDVAILYCLLSPQVTDVPRSNRLHWMSTTSIHYIDIVNNVLMIPIDFTNTLRRCEYYRLLMCIRNNNVDAYTVARMLYQPYITVNETTVFVDSVTPGTVADGSASEFYGTTLSLYEVNAVVQFCMTLNLNSMSSSDVVDAFEKGRTNIVGQIVPVFNTLVAPTYVKNYANTNTVQPMVPICRRTMRPYTTVDGGMYWEYKATQHHGCAIRSMLSATKYFIDYVAEYGSYPTTDELVLFMYKKVNASETNRRDTLPAEVINIADSVIADYTEVIIGVTPEEFNNRIKNSVNINKRIEIENS